LSLRDRVLTVEFGHCTTPGGLMRVQTGLILTTLALLASARPIAAQSIVGHVIADVTDEPVVAATVQLLDSYRNVRMVVTTDTSGRFVLRPRSAGSYHLRVQSIGYKSTTTPAVAVDFADELLVRIVLSPDVVLLAPLEIHARSRPLLREMTMQGFEERRQLGLGVAITRETIERRQASAVTDLLRMVPSVRVVQRENGSSDVVIPGAARQIFGGQCRVQIYLDGRKYRWDATALDLISTWDVEAIEVFRSLAELPAEMADPEARCGAIAVWTRRGG
jgi:hypothetical protein